MDSKEVQNGLHTWYTVNDFVIGVYCLLLFMLPLINYIKVEIETDHLLYFII